MFETNQMCMLLKRLQIVAVVQYLCQFLVKSSQQGQFRKQLVLRIPKPTLALRFDKDLAEILEVEEKASNSESPRFLCRWV